MADPFALCGDVERRLVEDDVPALSVAVLCGSELACRTWGARTFDGEAINRRTLFQAGSVSKPVTAVGVLRLVAEGALDLDADVNEYLTTWKVPSVGHSQECVTLRQLLTHTAGLTVPGFPGYARDARLPTLEQILDGVAPANTEAVRIATKPGIAWQYSGGGTTVVQAAVVDVTGEAFSDLMRRLVLEPCGMSDATFEQPLPDDRHGREAIGHRDRTSVRGGWHVYPEMAAAGLWCTPTDLMHFVREVNRAVAGETRAILPKALGELLVTPITAAPPEGGMAIGFRLDGPAPHRSYSHDGIDEGFLTTLRAATDGSHAIAVMANSFSARPIMNHVIDMVATATRWT